MLQVTLARDAVLVGYGHTSPFESGHIHKQNNEQRGCRPALFFAPKRDAHSLISRKMHTMILLRAKVVSGGEPLLTLLNFPEGENTHLSHWKDAIGAEARAGVVSWIEMRQNRSDLPPNSDVYTQNFVPEFTPSHSKFASIEVNIQAFVHNNALREQVTLKNIPEGIEAYVLHWHEPEIGAAAMLQSTYIDFARAALVSYRADVWFGVQCWQKNQPAGVHFAECGENQRHRPSHGRFMEVLQNLLLPDREDLHQHCYVAHGHTDGMVLWRCDANSPFELRYCYANKMEKLATDLENDFSKAWAETQKQDETWVAKQKPVSQKLPQRLRDLYSRTLLALRQMQDPSGGIIAAPEFQFEFTACGGYGYCWGRDAGFISLAMDVCGMHKEAAHFYRYIARCQSDDGSFLHRHDMDGNLGASWGFLQPDETGSVIFGLAEHVKLSGDTTIARELKDMVYKGANWLAKSRHNNSKLPISGMDLWEERDGIHIYSVAAMYAGLVGAIDLYKAIGEKPPTEWQNAATDYFEIINSSQVLGRVPMVRTLKRRLDPSLATHLYGQSSEIEAVKIPNGPVELRQNEERVVDISQLGVLFPYKTLNVQKNGEMFSAQVELIAKTLWRQGGGIGRYEGDPYRNGNPWILTTLWLALTAAEVGKTELAQRCFDWTVERATPEGFFSEQVDPVTGKPAWVMPLTWSHAMFALSMHWLPQSVLEHAKV